MQTLKKLSAIAGIGALIAAIGSTAHAQVSDETAYVFNTFLFLSQGLIVMFMAAGFAMLEAGFVRSKNVSTILLKNISLFSIAGIMYYLVGYGIMYPGDFNGFLGLGEWLYNAAADSGLLKPEGAGEDWEAASYAKMSDWFFQMVFVATACSVVSGTVAERIKLWHFLVFVVVMSSIIYPITGSWQWGEGWLYAGGFYDFAGSTLVHSVGGWAALVGAIIIGPRLGRFVGGKSVPIPGSSMPLVALGTFILWFGWFGFNGGSKLEMGSADAVNAVANIYANTFIAAAAGCVAAMLLSQAMYGKTDLTLALNGVIGGLVSITAGPEYTNLLFPILIGAIGGLLIPLSVKALDALQIDDVVGAIPAHLVCGIWGTLAVGIFYPMAGGEAFFLWQLYGVLSIGAFVVITTGIVWFVLNLFGGLRPSEEDEMAGLDSSEVGTPAYPEFS